MAEIDMIDGRSIFSNGKFPDVTTQ